MSRHKSVVKFLVNMGIDKEANDRNGRTALHLAAMAGNEKVVKFSSVAGLTRKSGTVIP